MLCIFIKIFQEIRFEWFETVCLSDKLEYESSSDKGQVRKLLCPGSTVWKLEDFSVSQILREIKVGESRVSKTSVLTH